jgi:chromosome segregation protein
MTKINKIVMDGFKSFGKRTEFLFGNDYNCVLGPNGSGKSNVLDALCFVLGKTSSKSLRAEKSANLIYNGGKSKKPAKHGEVSVYFDNTKKVFPSSDETVKITRIIKKDGASKYKINDQSRTRQQIVDLLNYGKINPDSYNIILQGDIVKMVEMTPVERRQVIEEISGISVYEEKKNKALREMEKVDAKLGEADIVLKERKTYLKELKADRDQAIKYKGLNDKIRQNKASYLKIQMDKQSADNKKIADEIQKHKDEISSSEEKIANINKSISQKKNRLTEIKNEIEDKGEKEQIALQKELDQLRTNIATNKSRSSAINNEIVKIAQRKDQLQNNLSDVDEKIESFSSEKKDFEERKDVFLKDQQIIEKKISEFKKKHQLDAEGESIENMIEEIDKESESKQEAIQDLREKQQSLLRDKDQVEFQIKTIDEKTAKVAEIEKEHKKELDELKSKKENFKTATKDLNLKLDEASALAAKIIETEKSIHAEREELSKLKARNEGIQETLFANIAVKKILEQKSKFGKIHGTVAELGEVPSKYAAALEVAAGARMQSIVTETDEVAAKCITYLKSNKLGRASFLPLSKLKDTSSDASAKRLASQSGVEGLARDLVSHDTKFKKVFSYVFQNTLVVKDINTAKKLGVGKARMVTLDGDLTELSGAMHGGYRAKKTSSFKDSSLTNSITKSELSFSELESKYTSFIKRKSSLENDIVNLRELKATLEGDIIRTEKGLHLDSSDLEASKSYKEELKQQGKDIEKELEDVRSKIVEVNQDLAQVKTKRQELREKISQLKKPTLVAELNTFEQKRNEIREEIIKIDGEIKSIDTRSDEIFGRDKSNTIKIIGDIEKEQSEFEEELATLKNKINRQNQNLKEKEKSQEEFNVQFRDLFNQRSNINEEIGKHDNEIELIKERSRDKEKRSNTLSLQVAQIRAQLAALKEEFAQYEGVPLTLKRSEQDLKSEINQTERLKEKMGNVNLRALEIYETVEKEYGNLLEKKETLMKEQDDITTMMDEIETKKSDLFMETFNAINANFKRIFGSLSKKGEAYLEVEDPIKPFEAGLLFNVRLTGNKFMDIRSLSGGEKTLTALAFIFSIQEHDPASFYVLDEVDAALDKHNSEKFAKLIRNYADRAQYIIISHNDQVISEAETLYGVSMNEHGQSKVVSLKI